MDLTRAPKSSFSWHIYERKFEFGVSLSGERVVAEG